MSLWKTKTWIFFSFISKECTEASSFSGRLCVSTGVVIPCAFAPLPSGDLGPFVVPCDLYKLTYQF